MQRLTERVFALAPPGGLFDPTAIRNLFPDASYGARQLLLHRALGRGEVLHLTRGLYCLAEPFRKSHPHPFAVAALLCFPSHVSFESALAYHALIPEAVYGVSCATPRRSREYHTPLGHFTFVRVPTSDPTAGVKAVRLTRRKRGRSSFHLHGDAAGGAASRSRSFSRRARWPGRSRWRSRSPRSSPRGLACWRVGYNRAIPG